MSLTPNVGKCLIFFLLIGHVSKWLLSFLFADAREVLSWSADKRLKYLHLPMIPVKKEHRITIQIFLSVIQSLASSKHCSKGSLLLSRHFIKIYFLLFSFYLKHAAFSVKKMFSYTATYIYINWFPSTIKCLLYLLWQSQKAYRIQYLAVSIDIVKKKKQNWSA